MVSVSTSGDDLILDDLAQLSSGVEPASELPQVADLYVPDAFVPRGPWMNLDGALGFREQARSDIPKCGVIRLPRALLEELLDVRARFPPETATLNGIPKAAFTPLTDYLLQHFGARGTPAIHGAKWDAPNQVTVTVDSGRNRFLGLHLDSWDGSTYGARRAARTRISVNLGPGVKSFLCAPICVDEVARSLRLDNLERSASPTPRIIPLLFKTVGDLPILRLNLPPGTGYYADTDNLIHDGSTLLSPMPLMTYTVRAHFENL